MSAVEPGGGATLVPGAFVPVLPSAAGRIPMVPRRWQARLFRSEMRLVFRRRRNLAALALLAVIPILVGVAVDLAGAPSGGEGPPFIAQITGNGFFVALTALTVEVPLFLPLAVALVSGDSIAGEANIGTLRYLLTVPVGRTRLLGVKFATITLYTLASVIVVALAGLATGLILFGGGEVTLLSGAEIPFGSALLRLGLVCLFLAACLVALGAIGLFVSTLTEQPIGATLAVVAVAVGSQILASVPQLSAIHPYLLTHYWTSFGDLLRGPMEFGSIGPGLLSAGIYTVLFASAAWARFGSKDITA